MIVIGRNPSFGSVCRCELNRARPWQAPVIDGAPYLGCPVHDERDVFLSYLLSLYAHYKSGFLLRSGGLDVQPALYLTAMEFIGAKVSEIDADSNEGK